MIKKSLLVIVLGVFVVASLAAAATINERLSGRILLQVEENGEGWYVNPTEQKRYYLGRPADAFAIMRELGLGISNKDFDSFKGKAPKRLSGRILLKIEDLGKAYYVNPVDLKMHYLGRPADAFKVMRELGLGITNSDLGKINIAAKSAKPQTEADKMNKAIGGVAEINPVENLPEANMFTEADTNPFSGVETNPFK